VAADQEIVIARHRIPPDQLSRLVASHFQDMVKFVVDVERGLAAVGGELHADAEELLIEDGSRQADLWGGNYHPGRGEAGCIEYTSLINIRPVRGNPAMEVSDPELRERMRAVVFAVLGRGEPLS
jgi:hypothetical protein